MAPTPFYTSFLSKAGAKSEGPVAAAAASESSTGPFPPFAAQRRKGGDQLIMHNASSSPARPPARPCRLAARLAGGTIKKEEAWKNAGMTRILLVSVRVGRWNGASFRQNAVRGNACTGSMFSVTFLNCEFGLIHSLPTCVVSALSEAVPADFVELRVMLSKPKTRRILPATNKLLAEKYPLHTSLQKHGLPPPPPPPSCSLRFSIIPQRGWRVAWGWRGEEATACLHGRGNLR